MKKYEALEHTADLKIRAFGKNKEEVFANMAIGMFVSISDKKNILKDQVVERKIKIKAMDLQALLIDFLSELVTLSDINNEIYLNYKLQISNNKLSGIIKGYKIKGLKLEIKAVTYNDLKIEKKDGEWLAEVVFDI